MDSMNTYFDESTDYALTWYQGGSIPALYHHGFDADRLVNGKTVRGYGLTPVGRAPVSEIEVNEDGLWGKCQIEKSAQYFDQIMELLDAEHDGKDSRLFHSTGSVGHQVRCDASTGHMTQWPIVEVSYTPSPANLYAKIGIHDVRSACRAAGLDDLAILNDSEYVQDDSTLWIRATLNQEQKDALPDSDFAYISSDGERHLIMNDAGHCQAAMGRFNQQEFESEAAAKSAWSKLLARANKLGMKVSDETMPTPKIMAAKSADVSPARDAMDTVSEGIDTAGGNLVDEKKKKKKILGKEPAPETLPAPNPEVMPASKSATIELPETPESAPEVTDALIDEASRATGVPAEVIASIAEQEVRATIIAPKKGQTQNVNLESSIEDIKDDIEDQLNPDEGSFLPAAQTYKVMFMFPDSATSGYCIVKSFVYPDWEDATWLKFPYSLDENSEPVLDVPSQLEQTFVPARSHESALPLTLDAQRLTRNAEALSQRTKDLKERRATENRSISEVNRNRVAEATASLRTAADGLDELLVVEEPEAKDSVPSPSVRIKLLDLASQFENLT
jgi:ribosomal protein S8E